MNNFKKASNLITKNKNNPENLIENEKISFILEDSFDHYEFCLRKVKKSVETKQKQKENKLSS